MSTSTSTSKPLTHRSTGASPPSSSSQARHASSAVSGVSRPPVRASSSATIPDSISFQGTNLVTIGAGSVLHPRIKILAFDGPVTIGEGCIIGEKSVIGGSDSSNLSRRAGGGGGSKDDGLAAFQTPTSPQSPSEVDAATSRSVSTPAATTTTTQESKHNSTPNAHTIISNSVTVGPLSVINAGSYIHSGAIIDTMVSLGRNVHIGGHAKICANCTLKDNTQIKEWMVVWGGGGRAGLGRVAMRKRANDRGGVVTGGGRSKDGDGGTEQEVRIMGGRAVEEGRLVVLSKEREVLRKLIAPAGGPRKK